jgi:hypothetical protein
MRVGMPRDFDDLVQLHGNVIERVAPKEVLSIAHHLLYRGTFEQFRPPALLTRDEVIGYLGISPSTWANAARRRPHVLPPPVEGRLTLKSSKYRFSDAERCFLKRDEFFPRMSQKGFFVTRIPGFDAFLEVESKKLHDELALGYIFDLPTDLPQTDKEVHEQYQATVARVVRYRLKFGIDVEDAISEIWVKLFNSQLLIKFMRSGPKRLPATLTTEEVLDYLGVEWFSWRRMLTRHAGAPNPVKGAAKSPDAVYRSEDIRALDESGYFKKRGLRFLPPAAVSKQMLDKYIARSAEHALKNLFRTLDRRFNKEDVLQEGACIQDNRRVRVVRRDDFDLAWEDTLSSNEVSAESLIDIKRRVERMEIQQTG